LSVPSFWRRTLAGFVPASPEAEQVLARVKLGDVVKITMQRPRSLQWLRLYWGGLVAFIEENSSCSAKQVDALIKLRTGLVPAPGDFGPVILPLDEALDFVATESFFWIGA